MDVSRGQPVLGNEYYRMTCLFVYQHEISYYYSLCFHPTYSNRAI